MRKITVFLGLIVLVVVAVGSRMSVQTARIGNRTAELYFVDSAMLRLIPTEYDVGHVSRQKAAEKVVEALIAGRDDNDKILRLIPNIRRGITVKVDNNTAVVNLTAKMVAQHSDERTHEILTIYSIVNSLTSVEGIDNVKFTIDGKTQKRFKGFVDMRETFIPDYYI